MKTIALAAISAYRHHVSPYKGFCCAYRVRTGHRSCSVLGYRAIRRYGVWPGVAVLRRRFARCTEAYRQHAANPTVRRGQEGFCDIGCPCDVPSCDLPSIDCPDTDTTECCIDLPCDCSDIWGSRKKKDDEKPVYVPPPRRGIDDSRRGPQ